MKAKKTPFSILEFTNPSGKIVFQLYAFIDGKRFRQNFPTRAEAEAERQVQEVNFFQRDSGVRAAITRLSEDQLHEAESVFRRLEGQARSLTFYVDFALANYREPEKQKSLADAVTDYVAAKAYEFKQDQISVPQMQRIRWEMKRLTKAFPRKTVAEITATALTELLEKERPGMKTHNNRRGIFSTFFKYAFQRGWIAENPILKVPHYRIRKKRGSAKTFSADQAAKLMEFLRPTTAASGCLTSRSAFSPASGRRCRTVKSRSSSRRRSI